MRTIGDDAGVAGWAATSAGLASPSADFTATPAARRGTVKPQLAAETLRLYAGDWALFQKFCAARGMKPLPAAAELVGAFLASPGCGRAALSRRLAAIDHQHRHRGFAPPGMDPALRLALQQARRAAPAEKRAPAPTPASLERMADTCRGDLTGRRDRAMLLLLAAGLGRAALVGLQAELLRFTEADVTGGDGVSVARSDTLASCPVRALEEWLRTSATRYGPVFRKVNRWGQVEIAALGADAVRLILARRRVAQ